MVYSLSKRVDTPETEKPKEVMDDFNLGELLDDQEESASTCARVTVFVPTRW